MATFFHFFLMLFIISSLAIILYLTIKGNLKYNLTARRLEEIRKEFDGNVNESNVKELIGLLKKMPEQYSPSAWESMRACYHLVNQSSVSRRLIEELRNVMVNVGVNRLKR